MSVFAQFFGPRFRVLIAGSSRNALFQIQSKFHTVCPNCRRPVVRMGMGCMRVGGVTQSPRFSSGQIRWFTSEKAKDTPELKDLKQTRKRMGPVSWKSMGVSVALGSIVVAAMWYMKKKKEEEREKMRRQAVGKSKIGGPWELVCQNGKLMNSTDFHGKWILIYFGFTHCPDICPDEIEKMCKVAEILKKDHPIHPLFFSVDPERDTPEAVKKYCEEFSPKLIGFTGSPEQVKKVSRTFRVYHSEGPRDEFNDYIVDHSVIMYLIDPEGSFVDYYGQNKQAPEIAEGIKLQIMKYDMGKQKGWW